MCLRGNDCQCDLFRQCAIGAGIPGLLPPRFALQSRWLVAGGDWTGKAVIVWVYRAARYGFHKTVNQQSWGPARRRRHQGILSVDAGAAGIRRWCLSAQPSNWRGGPVRRRGRREMEIPARQYVVGTPGIVAHQRAVVDVRGQAPWRSVSASA
jgi:hypothetical protein